MTTTQSTAPFITDDLGVVAALAMYGIHPHTSDTIGRKQIYIFEKTAYLLEVLGQYDRGMMIGSIKMFMLIYRDLVSQVRRTQTATVAAQGSRQ